MSMDRCWRCGDLVDTDDDPDAYVRHRGLGRDEFTCYCETCRDEKFACCDHCGNYVAHEDIVPDTLMCGNCAVAAADLLHDMAKEG